MLLRRGLFAALIGLGLAFFALPALAATDDFSAGAHKFVRQLADNAIKSMTGEKVTDNQRVTRFRGLFRQYFDLTTIGKRVLGRHWRKAKPVERKEFLSLFENLIVTTYGKRFRAYTNETLTISGAAPRGQSSTTVHSRVRRGNGAPGIRVDWRVGYPDGSYKIIDVVVEGVSLVQTQRSEFTSVILRNGGKVGGLVSALRAKKFDMGEGKK